MANFKLFFPTLLKHEGGFVNNQLDPGGATNKGITLNTFRQYVNSNGTIEDLKKLTDAQAEIVYKKNYWDALKLDSINHQKLAETMFDMGVNAGVSRSAKMFQYVLNKQLGKLLTEDGSIGISTIAAVQKANLDIAYNDFNNLRKKYYTWRTGTYTQIESDTTFIRDALKVSANPTQIIFEKGWLKRLASFEPITIAKTAGIGIGIIALGVGIFFLIKKMKKKK